MYETEFDMLDKKVPAARVDADSKEAAKKAYAQLNKVIIKM